MRFDCADGAQLEAGLDAAESALQDGRLVVLPTDTVYGIAADAFSHSAVAALLAAKGRDRGFPPPVLVADRPMAAALAERIPPEVEALLDIGAEPTSEERVLEPQREPIADRLPSLAVRGSVLHAHLQVR